MTKNSRFPLIKQKNKNSHPKSTARIGDLNGMNLEPAVRLTLLLTSDYYQATLERYEAIIKSGIYNKIT